MKKIVVLLTVLCSGVLNAQSYSASVLNHAEASVRYGDVNFYNDGSKKHLKKKRRDSVLKAAELENKEILLVLKDKAGNECYSKFIITMDEHELLAIDIEKRVTPGKYLVIGTSFNKMYGRKVQVR